MVTTLFLPTRILIMTDKQTDNSSSVLLSELQHICRWRRRCDHPASQTGMPLTESCCNRRIRVCSVNGDRQTCARMANLGVLPGSELELLCKGGGQQCMIQVNGGTISLDASTASTILVTPV